MKQLNPSKLHITDLTGNTSGINNLPRRYTLTHSDLTGNSTGFTFYPTFLGWVTDNGHVWYGALRSTPKGEVASTCECLLARASGVQGTGPVYPTETWCKKRR